MLAALIVIILFAFLLSGLLVAFVLRRDFRDAVLAGPGEATVFGLLSVKGVAIVLLCALLIGGILMALNRVNVSPQVVEQKSPLQTNRSICG